MSVVKKIYLFLAFSMLIEMSASAFYYDIQARIGFYSATSHQAGEAFKHGTPVYQLEGSCFFANPWEKLPWKAWLNLSYMTGEGHSDRLGHTKSNMTLLSGGVKYSWIIDCYGEFYFGFGPTMAWVRLKTNDPKQEGFWDGSWHGHRKISEHQLGAFIKTGYQVKLYNYILCDVFADYLLVAFHYKNYARSHLFPAVKAQQKVHKFERRHGHHRLNLGGFNYGVAIGVPF